MDCSPPGFSVYEILQARILKGVAIPFSKVSSQPRDQTWVSCTAGRFFTVWATREALIISTSFKVIYLIYMVVWCITKWWPMALTPNLITRMFPTLLHLPVAIGTCPVWFSGKESTCSAGVAETWVQSLGQEDPLEYKMATHSSIVAWEILWTEEPVRPQSMGRKESDNDWATNTSSNHWTTREVR